MIQFARQRNRKIGIECEGYYTKEDDMDELCRIAIACIEIVYGGR